MADATLVNRYYQITLELVYMTHTVNLINQRGPKFFSVFTRRILVILGQTHVKLIWLVSIFHVCVVRLVILLVIVIFEHLRQDVALDARVFKPLYP